jgi:hypothetical protein
VAATQAAKDAARSDCDYWSDMVDYGGFAIVAMAAHPIGWLPMTAAGALVLVGRKKARSAARIVEDPARDDVETRTRARTASSQIEALARSPNGSTLAGATFAILEAAGYEEAMVKADERAQGARLRDRRDLERARLAEVVEFGNLAANANERIARSISPLADWLASTDSDLPPELEQPRMIAPRSTVDEVLPDEAAATLFRAGFHVNDLRFRPRWRRREDPNIGGQLAERLTSAAASSLELSAALRGWIDVLSRTD